LIDLPPEPERKEIPKLHVPPSYEVVERVERTGKEWWNSEDGVREKLIALGASPDWGQAPRWEGVH
jgi:hypothetical protein